MFNYNALSCKHNVRPCLIIEALECKGYIRKCALTTSHPSVTDFYQITDNLNTNELQVLNSIDNQSVYDILHS